jgi:hypothetical protein
MEKHKKSKGGLDKWPDEKNNPASLFISNFTNYSG